MRFQFAAISFLTLSCAVANLGAATPIPSFPGAVGYGAAATGGATLAANGINHTGGTVYHVTNLNDSGPGSFRTGVATSGNIVVFDVGGSIQSLSPVSVASNVSIEGQTAPGGIQVFGSETSFYGSKNIICRYMHFRDGTLDPNYPGPNATDSHTNAANMGATNNIIMDHCCFEFAAYNNIDSAGAVDVTIQNCLFADPIREQQFNCHFETGPVTMIDNLWANSHGRNPLGKGDMQYVNNVVYNYQYAMTTGNSSGNFHWDVINNYFISGPSTTNANDCYYQVDSNQSAYAIGNYLDSNRDGALNGGADNGVDGATVLGTYWFPNTNETIATTSLPTVSAQAAFYDDISNAGPLPHDPVDSQVVGNVLSIGTQGMLWGNQTATGLGNSGYGVITSGTALPDSDASGMPDDWKAAMGLSMTNPAAGGVTASNGYTNLENYLAWKAQPNAWVAKNTSAQPTSVSIDLSQYTNGFASGSTFTVTDVIAGTVTQSGAGGYLVNFVPTTGTSGLGGFNWSVTNGITTLTSTCGVLISQSGPAQTVQWKGDSVNNYWNLTSTDWIAAGNGVATSFSNQDPVNFTDTGSVSPAVNINTAITPGSMTFNTYADNYTLSGTGSIGGTGTLVKEGSASLTISNSGGNTFSGGAVLNAGTVYMDNGSALGSGTTTLNGADLEINANISIGMPIAVNVASTIGLDAKGSDVFLGGAISGASPLAVNFNSTGIVFTPSGSWSSYTGTVTFSGPAAIRIDNNPWGFPNATVNLDGADAMYNRYGYATALTIPIGALNGVSTSNIGGSDQGGSAGGTVTYTIGSLNLPSDFAGSITNSANQIVALTELGTSTLTLSGSSTYTGPTSVSSGTLILTGSLGNTALTVSSGATLVSNSIVSGTTTLDAGSSLYLGNSTTMGVIGKFTAGTGFVVAGGASGASLYYSLSNSPTATGSNDLITAAAGSLNLSGSINFIVDMTNGVLGAGTYNLINGDATQNGSPTMYLDLAVPVAQSTATNYGYVTRQTFGLQRPAAGTTPGYVNLVVANNAGSLTWTGTSGATWDLDTTADWSGASPAAFYDLDSVTFNDTDTNGTLTLSGTLQPNLISVSNNVTSYTFNGTGGLVGATELIKSGTGSLTVNNTGNTFTGPIYLNAGALHANAWMGTGTIYLNGGTLYLPNYPTGLGNSIVVDQSSTIVGGQDTFFLASTGATLSSTSAVTLTLSAGNNTETMDGGMTAFQGTLELGTDTGTLRLDNGGSALALFDLGTSTVTVGNRNGGITDNFGAVEGGPGTTLSGRTSGSGDTTSNYVVGALNTNTTFAGDIANNGDLSGLNITKVGSGNWTLSGTSNFTGDIYIQQGTLTISGSDNNNGLNFEVESGATFDLAGGTVTTEVVQIDQGAFFTGYGTINGSLTNEGTNSLTTATGTATVTGPLTVNGNFQNDGAMTVDTGGLLITTLAIDGGATFVNNGTLDLRNSPQTELPVGYVNNGTILTSSPLIVVQGLVWAGDGTANAWNTTTANWTSLISGSAVDFSALDPVTFTDGGSTSPAVNISTVVSPGTVEVEGTASNYTFSGSGGLGGTGGLETDSTGILTLSSSNTFTGATLLDSGTLQAVATSSNTKSGVSYALSPSSTLTQAVGTTLGFLGNTNNTIFAPASLVEPNTTTGATYNLYVNNDGSGAGNTLIVANVGQFGGAGFGGAITYNLAGANGYTLQLGSNSTGTGALDFYNNTVLNSTTPGVTLSIPGGLIDNYPASYTLTFTGSGNVSIGAIVPYSATLTPTPAFVGTGTVTLTGSNTYTASTTVTSGEVAVVNGGSINDSPQILVANVSGTAAAVYQSGGSVSNSLTTLGGFQVGSAVGALGYYNLSGGTINPGGEFDAGGSSGGAGTFGQFDMTGGTVNLPAIQGTYFLANRGASGEASVVNILGGTVQIAGGAIEANNGFNGLAANWGGASSTQVATITIGGSGQFLTPSLTVKLNGNSVAAPSATSITTLNLNGGTLQTLGFGEATGNTTGNANAYINFNGGTVEAGNAANTTFLNSLAAVFVYSGGGVINNNGQAITVAQSIQPPSGEGVTAVAVSTAGTGYTVPPQITFTGGGGSGATAYATISSTSGAVTGIVITCPGTGYTSAPAATLTGTTTGTAAVLGTVTVATNAATGGITFSGTGTTSLSTVQAYTGPTVVTSGTLAITNTSNTPASGLNTSSAITINNGATINITTTTDNAFLGYNTSSTAPVTINAGGTLTTSDSSQLEKLVLAGGTLAENTPPTADQAAWGVYELAHGVSAGGTAATSIISAQDISLTESGGTVFNVSSGATNGIDLDVTGGFSHASSLGTDTGLVKTGNGVMVLGGASNFSSPTTVSAGTLEIMGGSLATTGVTVSSGATLAMATGSITTSGTIQIANGAFFTGHGTLNATLFNQGYATVNGPLAINGSFQNNGTMLVTGSGTLTVTLTNGGTFVNNGTLDIMDSPNTVLPAGYVNNGTILNSSLVTVQQVGKSGNTFSVTIQSYTGHTYQLEKTASLTAPSWQTVGAAVSGTTGSALILTDTNATAGSSFYQVGVGP